MKRKKIIATIAVLGMALLTGCGGKQYPEVIINTSVFSSYRTISIGNPYEYIGFDIESTDGGKDLILHFETERRNDERMGNS
jgi:hypothetical protein